MGEAATSEHRIDALADLLASQGDLTLPVWREALHAVPRDGFIPARAWASPDGPDDAYPIDRDARPGEWWNAVYSDTAIITQMDDGATDPATGAGQRWTSSASAPGVLVDFLERLAPLDGHRVLEIGTGTGWTAALLSHRVGAGNVISIEVDPDVAATAAANLKAAGYTPRLVIEDGAAGYPDAAPFDRVHVTCAVTGIPAAWLTQTRPGGVIVAPFDPGFGYGHKLKLRVVSPELAVGRFAGGAVYMEMRSQRYPVGRLADFLHHEADRDVSETCLDPRPVAGGEAGADLMISAMVPGVRRHLGHDAASGEATLWLLERHPTAMTDGSWAVVEYAPGRNVYAVEQYGPRRLWDEVSAAYLRWIELGSPGRDRFGITVTPGGQAVWLDDPGNLILP